MANAETLIHQITETGLDLSSLLSLRDAIGRRIAEAKRDLQDRLRLLDAVAVQGSGVRRARSKPGSDSRPRAKHSAGRNEGSTVGEAVRKAIAAGGGRLSTAQIREAFDAARDRRPVNLSILVRSGQLKVVGKERHQGKRGPVGSIFAVR
jgi:hypothetical protein